MDSSEARDAKVVEMPSSGYCNTQSDVIRELRTYTDELEALDEPSRNIIILRETSDGIIEKHVIGGPIDGARLLGLLAYSLLTVMSDD